MMFKGNTTTDGQYFARVYIGTYKLSNIKFQTYLFSELVHLGCNITSQKFDKA